MSAVSEAICKKLQSDGDLMSLVSDAYPFIAPEGATYPLVIVNVQSPPIDDYTFGGIAYESSIYLVKVVDQNVSPARAEDARKRIQVALQDAQLSIDGQTLLMLRRRSQFPEYSEQVNGLIYVHRGALYDAIVSN